MKQLGLSFKMYANESAREEWPRLEYLPDTWAPNLAALYPNFLNDPSVLVSPSHPEGESLLRDLNVAMNKATPDFDEMERVMGESYGYLGFSLKNEDDFEVLRKAKVAGALPAEGAALSIPGAEATVHPLREGIERFLITDINNPAGSAAAQSTVPVVIEIAPWKYKKSLKAYKGANVLYMDGHVDFVPYGTFPVVDSVLNALSGL